MDKKKKLKQLKIEYLQILQIFLSIKKKGKNYYKPVIASNFWSSNYIRYARSDDRNKTLSVEEYLNKIRPYLKDIIRVWRACNAFKNWYYRYQD